MSLGREVSEAEWLEEIRNQPRALARLLTYETRFGNLRVDDAGNVWNGGIGPGYGTAYTLGRSDRAEA